MAVPFRFDSVLQSRDVELERRRTALSAAQEQLSRLESQRDTVSPGGSGNPDGSRCDPRPTPGEPHTQLDSAPETSDRDSLDAAIHLARQEVERRTTELAETEAAVRALQLLADQHQPTMRNPGPLFQPRPGDHRDRAA